MFHITIAIGRFFEILLFDIVKSIAGLIVLAMVIALGGVAIVLGLRRWAREFRK